MESSAVQVSDLHKSFGAETILNGISLEVPEGRTVAVLGRSGTGKSVLLKLLLGLQAPDSGSIKIAGQEITNLDGDSLNTIRKTVGFLFQQAALYDYLTVEQNVEFPLRRHATLSDSDRRDKVNELLSGVGIDRQSFAKLPSEISGGMQKRVGLARALALEPKLLLLDEPTAGLNPITAAEIGQLIVDLKQHRGIAAVVVTHDIRGARTFSDYMLLLHKGTVVSHGTYEELCHSADEFTARFLGDGESAEVLRGRRQKQERT